MARRLDYFQASSQTIIGHGSYNNFISLFVLQNFNSYNLPIRLRYGSVLFHFFFIFFFFFLVFFFCGLFLFFNFQLICLQATNITYKNIILKIKMILKCVLTLTKDNTEERINC